MSDDPEIQPESEWQSPLLTDRQREIPELFDGIPSIDEKRILKEVSQIKNHYDAMFEKLRKRVGK